MKICIIVSLFLLCSCGPQRFYIGTLEDGTKVYIDESLMTNEELVYLKECLDVMTPDARDNFTKEYYRGFTETKRKIENGNYYGL